MVASLVSTGSALCRIGCPTARYRTSSDGAGIIILLAPIAILRTIDQGATQMLVQMFVHRSPGSILLRSEYNNVAFRSAMCFNAFEDGLSIMASQTCRLCPRSLVHRREQWKLARVREARMARFLLSASLLHLYTLTCT